MFLSVFDLFKIGIGPSSSHTMGPMSAANMFLDSLRERGETSIVRLRCTLHGSLAFTGKGHATDRAVILGLTGCTPDTVDPDMADEIEREVRQNGRIAPPALPEMTFDPGTNLIFDYGEPLPGHSNGMSFAALDDTGAIIASRIYYSIGGGFVVEASELEAAIPAEDVGAAKREEGFPYPFGSAEEMIRMSDESGLSLVEMKRANEGVSRAPEELDAGLDAIWDAMRGCMERGLRMDGQLPGGLFVKRRAKAIREALIAEHGTNAPDPYAINEWLSVYAMAVNEENAAGGRVVTAPTNGAAGVVPAVI
ncbi:UNVERIFIED_CONTAM: hypothetical protein GTU68_016492, partial [Idotea baltica]|nr:hypothetical protein [Idotea baltica]